MRNVDIHRASPVGEKQAEEVVISISTEVPDATFSREQDWRKAADELYGADAKAIEEALLASLPGGTYDRLLGEMLARKASYFRVTF